MPHCPVHKLRESSSHFCAAYFRGPLATCVGLIYVDTFWAHEAFTGGLGLVRPFVGVLMLG